MRILSATRSLMARKGRRGTTTREIAELAGVNEATVFRHFGNKDALIEECARHFCAAVELEGLIGRLSGDLTGDLRTLALALTQRMESLRDLIVMSLLESENEENGHVVGDAAWRAPFAIHKMINEFMSRRVASGELRGDPVILARFFMGMIFAAVIGRKKFRAEQSPEELVDFKVDVFLNGVRSR